jgi:hypothetical protein
MQEGRCLVQPRALVAAGDASSLGDALHCGCAPRPWRTPDVKPRLPQILESRDPLELGVSEKGFHNKSTSAIHWHRHGSRPS